MELLSILADRQRQPTFGLARIDKDDVLPFQVHATYTRDEIAAGLRLVGDKGKLVRTQGGVLEAKGANADIFFVTLDKDPRHFTPTTLYNDYPISPTRFHWESQSTTSPESRTGQRYIHHSDAGDRIILFVRERRKRVPRGRHRPCTPALGRSRTQPRPQHESSQATVSDLASATANARSVLSRRPKVAAG